MERYNLNESSAKKAIKRKDESRKRFLSFFSDERYQDDPLFYDLVINMDRLGLDRSEELICSVVAQMSS